MSSHADLELGAAAPISLQTHLAQPAAGITVISLVGDVDLATTDVFAAALLDLAAGARDGDRIVLNLGQVTFLAAHGLATIARANDHTHHNGATILLLADHAGPIAPSLRFLPSGPGPIVRSSLTAALAATPAGTTTGPGSREIQTPRDAVDSNVPAVGHQAVSDPRDLARRSDEVIAALGRLAEDTFARRDVCAARIPDQPLDVNPATDRCTDHPHRPDTDGQRDTDHQRHQPKPRATPRSR